MSGQQRVKKEEEAARANLWGKVVTKEDIERCENIIQELKKREMARTRVFYQALHEIYDPQRGGDKSKVMHLMNSYHKS